MSALPALTLAEITERGLDPAFRLLPPKMDAPEARVIELCVGLQESGFRDRRQIVWAVEKGKRVLRPLGPARSFWGAEQGGGMVRGVRTHWATRDYAAALYEARQVKPTDKAIWGAIENDDVLAAGLARLLLYTDPRPLPRLGDVRGAWTLYADPHAGLWRPGKPKPETWPGYYQRALQFVTGADA
jgi:hypothetical protein